MLIIMHMVYFMDYFRWFLSDLRFFEKEVERERKNIIYLYANIKIAKCAPCTMYNERDKFLSLLMAFIAWHLSIVRGSNQFNESLVCWIKREWRGDYNGTQVTIRHKNNESVSVSCVTFCTIRHHYCIYLIVFKENSED